MESVPKRPWYRLHWVTWVVSGVTASALINCEMEPNLGDFWMSLSYEKETLFGWPLDHLTVVETGPTGPYVVWHWHYPGLIFNLTFCLLLTATTAHVVELWLRSANRMQVHLASLFGIIAVVAILVGLASGTINFTFPWGGYSYGLINWYFLRRLIHWPIAFSLGCMLYSLSWLALALLRRAVSYVCC